NDLSELEGELKKLRPARVSPELISRVERALADARDDRDNIIRPESRRSGSEFRVSWLGLGLGLAAAAGFLIFARIDFRPPDKTKAGPAGRTLAKATPTVGPKAPAVPQHPATGL